MEIVMGAWPRDGTIPLCGICGEKMWIYVSLAPNVCQDCGAKRCLSCNKNFHPDHVKVAEDRYKCLYDATDFVCYVNNSLSHMPGVRR